MRLFNKSSYQKNIFTLLSGAAAAQAILLLIYPLLTRIYSPAQFGLFGIFSAFVLIIGEVSNGRYDLSIMLPKKVEEAGLLFSFSVIIALILSILLLPVFYFTADLFSIWLDTDINLIWFLLICPSIFLAGFIQASTQYLNRLKLYKKISIIRMVQSLSTAFISLLMGYKWGIGSGLIIGFILGQLIASGMNFYFLWQHQAFIRFFSVIEQWILAKSYTAFPKYSVMGSWLTTASRQLPFFVFPYFFGANALGYFTLANRFLGVPLSIISGSVAQVFYEKASKAAKSGLIPLQKITIGTLRSLFLIGIIPMILLIAMGPFLFGWVFGAEWYPAGEYVSWLAPWMFFSALLAPASYLIDIQGKLKFDLIYSTIVFIIRLALIVAGGMFSTDLFTIQLYAIIGVLSLFVYLYYVLDMIGLSFRSALSRLLSNQKE